MHNFEIYIATLFKLNNERRIGEQRLLFVQVVVEQISKVC